MPLCVYISRFLNTLFLQGFVLTPLVREFERKISNKKMIRLRSKRFSRSNSNLIGTGGGDNGCKGGGDRCEIKWELRPGGMLVQKRENGGGAGEEMITIRVSNGSCWHDITIQATSTFGELKMILALVTSLEPKDQRLLYKGKERENGDYLHMVGVRNMDKVVVLEDPAIKERKLVALALAGNQAIGLHVVPLQSKLFT